MVNLETLYNKLKNEEIADLKTINEALKNKNHELEESLADI